MFLNFFNLKTKLEKVMYLFSQELSLLKYRKVTHRIQWQSIRIPIGLFADLAEGT